MSPTTLKRTLYSAFALLLLAATAFGIALLRDRTSPATHVQTQGNNNTIGNSSLLYSPGLGAGLESEAGELEDLARFWHERVTFPTGNFNPLWLNQSQAQDRLIQSAVPAGRVIYNRSASNSPLTLDPTRFTSLGPAPLDWFVGQTSGRVNALAADPTVPGVVYLGVAGGGVWKTVNCCSAATEWQPTTDITDVNGISVGDVTVDPNNHNVVYAGTGDLNFTLPEYSAGGILKSTDAGASWTVLGATTFAPPFPGPPAPIPEDQAIGKVRVDPRNSNNVVAGTKTGLFFSYNAGLDWSGPCYTNSYTATQRQDVTGLILRDTGTATEMYVAQGTRGYTFTVQPNFGENGANGIYKATLPASGCPADWLLASRPDNGWPAGTGSGIPVYQAGGNVLGRIDMAIAPSTAAPGSNNVTLYAQVQSTQNVSGQMKGGQLGVWRSTDNGTTWEKRSDYHALNNGMCPNSYGDFPQNWFDQGIAVDPLNANKVYMDTFDLWTSGDGGTTFTDITCGYTSNIKAHPDHHAIIFLPSASADPNAGSLNLIAGTDGGVYSTTDGGTNWDNLNHSLSTLEFYSGDISGNFATSASPEAVGGMQDNGSAVVQFSGTPGPTNWQAIIGGDGIWSRIEPVLGQTAYLEQNGGHLYASTQGIFGPYSEITGNWRPSQRSGILPYEIYKNDCPSTGCTHLIIATNSVSETVTGLGNWVQVSPNFPGYVDQLSYSVSLSTTALIGTNLGMVAYGFGLGHGVMATWVDVSGGNTILPHRPILDVTTDPVNPLVGYAAIGGFDQNSPSTPGHVFQVTCSTNCASFTWLNKTGNLPDLPIDSILANPRYPQQVFAGSDWGLYYTNDITANPPTWYRFDAGLPHVMIWDMQIDRGFTTLSVWTRSRGAYVWPLPDGPYPPGSVTPSPTPLSVTPTSTLVPPSATGTDTPIPPTASSTAVLLSPTSTAATSTSTAEATPTLCLIAFSDVPPDSTFYQFVRCLACRGILGGYPDGTFRPGVNVTRGQIAKIVSNAAGFTEDPGPQVYEDVQVGSTFFDWINRLSNRGYMSGYPCGGPNEPCNPPNNRRYFRPGVSATRAQLAKIVSNAAGFEDTPPDQVFTDVPPAYTFYLYIQRLASRGIMGGYPCGGPNEPCDSQQRPYFRPGNNVTRGQTAKIVSGTFFPNCQTP